MYIAGYNMPGYMPEMDVGEFDTFDEAKQYIIFEMLLDADNAACDLDEDLATDLTLMAEHVNLESRPFTTPAFNNIVYWVQEGE